MKNDFFGEKTFEKAERKMIENAITGAIQKAKLKVSDINVLVAGDLLNQIISSSYAARAFNFPYLGVYGACSTKLKYKSFDTNNIMCYIIYKHIKVVMRYFKGYQVRGQLMRDNLI